MARNMTIENPDTQTDEFPDSGNTPSESGQERPDRRDDDDDETAPENMRATVDEIAAMSDPHALREFLASSMQQESKALRKLMTFVGRIEPKLSKLQEDYAGHRERTARLYSLATRGLVRS